MWRPTYTIPFWLIVGLVLVIVWPPGAVIALASAAYSAYRWSSLARRPPDDDAE